MIIIEICKYLNVKPTDIARPKYRHLKEYTYEELLTRLIYTKVRLREEFTELNESTIVKTLKNLFPNKPSTFRGYDKYLLNCINKKKCLKCDSIKDLKDFNRSVKETDGLMTSCRSCCLDYYQENREIILEQKSQYIQNNLKSLVAKNSLRRANKINATPVWADLDAIKQIYNECPEGYHVDHIIPLNNPLVSGLHTEANLQYLPAKENLSKGNKFTIE